jgi:hypothetical protein
MRTEKAMIACLDWLAYCLKIGWSVADVPRLEAIWWAFHDDEGNLCSCRSASG